MRFRRRFRGKSRVVWMPAPGTNYDNGNGVIRAGGPPTQHTAIEFIVLAGAINAEPDTVSAPLVVDNPIDRGMAGTTLPVYQQFSLDQTTRWGYRLRRIVGDMFIAGRPGDGNLDVSNSPGVLIQAGIIVRKVDSTGSPLAPANGQDVGSIENDTDPWVWRRQWVFGGTPDVQAFGVGANTITAFSHQTNIQYGTKHHVAVDQKTNRVIGPEERLFLDFTIWLLPLDGGSFSLNKEQHRWRIYALFPYRVLASGVSPTRGNRRNASR